MISFAAKRDARLAGVALLERDDGQRVLIVRAADPDPCRGAVASWHDDGRLVQCHGGRVGYAADLASAIRQVGEWERMAVESRRRVVVNDDRDADCLQQANATE
jgi:hypothetical protein